MPLRTFARLSGKRWRTPNRPDRMRRRQDWRCTCIQKLMAAELRIHTKAPLPLLHGGRGILFLCLGTGNVLLDLYASFQGCTIFDDNAGCIDVAHHNSRFLQLNALDAVQVSVHSTINYDAACLHVGADAPVRPDSKVAFE